MKHIPTQNKVANVSQLLLIEQAKACLSAKEILLWDYLFSFCTSDIRCAWISQKTLAELFNIKRSNLCKMMKELKRKGWLVIKQGDRPYFDLYPVCPTLPLWNDNV